MDALEMLWFTLMMIGFAVTLLWVSRQKWEL